MEKDNISTVIKLFITKMHIPVTQGSIEDEIAMHPEYNSLLAISDLLNNWHIPNAAYQLSFEELNTAEVPVPFIAFLNMNGFVVVDQIDEKQVTVSNENWTNHRLSSDEFKELYKGSILIAEKDETSGEADYALKRKKERLDEIRMPFIITGASIILISFLLLHSSFIAAFSWQIALLTLFKTAGLITSILLLIQSIDINNPLIQKLCGGDSNKNCNAILSSNAAKISNELSWSEIGFFYFAGTWLVLLFNSSHNSLMQMLAILNVASLPYTFYSIYYQWRIAKQWCIFCCTVQALLWLEFFAFISYFQTPIHFMTLGDWSNLLTGMALPILVWVAIKPYLLNAEQTDELRKEIGVFKYNQETFKNLLNKQTNYSLPSEDDSIVIGNREAEITITMVSDPFCKTCSEVHKVLDIWLASREDIKLQIIFSTLASKGDPRFTVAAQLMSLHFSENNFLLKQAINGWYKERHLVSDSLLSIYPIAENSKVFELLELQRDWCKVNINGVPVILINGKKLPLQYRVEDIKYLI